MRRRDYRDFEELYSALDEWHKTLIELKIIEYLIRGGDVEEAAVVFVRYLVARYALLLLALLLAVLVLAAVVN